MVFHMYVVSYAQVYLTYGIRAAILIEGGGFTKQWHA